MFMFAIWNFVTKWFTWNDIWRTLARCHWAGGGCSCKITNAYIYISINLLASGEIADEKRSTIDTIYIH
jgi:hypothetical protein